VKSLFAESYKEPMGKITSNGSKGANGKQVDVDKNMLKAQCRNVFRLYKTNVAQSVVD
jgi:hypothetical protein